MAWKCQLFVKMKPEVSLGVEFTRNVIIGGDDVRENDWPLCCSAQIRYAIWKYLMAIYDGKSIQNVQERFKKVALSRRDREHTIPGLGFLISRMSQVKQMIILHYLQVNIYLQAVSNQWEMGVRVSINSTNGTSLTVSDRHLCMVSTGKIAQELGDTWNSIRKLSK